MLSEGRNLPPRRQWSTFERRFSLAGVVVFALVTFLIWLSTR